MLFGTEAALCHHQPNDPLVCSSHLTPCIELAAHPMFSEICWNQKHRCFVQVVLECRVATSAVIGYKSAHVGGIRVLR